LAGGVADCYDNALAETINGLYMRIKCSKISKAIHELFEQLYHRYATVQARAVS